MSELLCLHDNASFDEQQRIVITWYTRKNHLKQFILDDVRPGQPSAQLP